MKETKICCICGNEFTGYGNNPAPLSEEGECCDWCNETKVIPERIRISLNSQSFYTKGVNFEK